MKKRYLAVLLAAAMMTCSGCSLSDVLSNINNVTDETDADDESDDEEENDEDENGIADPDDGGNEVVEEITVTNGPACVVTGLEDGYYYDNLTMSILCQQVFLYTPGYDALNATIEEINQYHYDDSIGYWSYDALDVLEAEQFGQNFADNGFGMAEWNYTVLMDVVRNDSQIFSLDVSTNSYVGGAHDYTLYVSYNVDAATGERLKLSDIVTDYDALYARVYEALSANYDPDMDFYEGWEETLHNKFYYESHFEDGMDKSWKAYEDGINLFFNGYELAPWAMGLVEVDLSYSENADIFKEEYFHTAGAVRAVNEMPANTQSEFAQTVIKDMANNLGVWNYDDCIAYMDKTGLEYEFCVPYESETSGDIWTDDPDNEFRAYFGFWPLDESLEVYSIETDALNTISYYNDDYCVIIGNNYNKGEKTYRLVDYADYETVSFNNLEDLWIYLSYCLNK